MRQPRNLERNDSHFLRVDNKLKAFIFIIRPDEYLSLKTQT